MMPFWNGDRDQAMQLARLLADLEPQHSELADFLFVARFDTKQDQDTVRQVSRKFNVHTHTSRRQEVGWPRGCNGNFFGGMEWVYHKMLAKQIPHYKSIFNMGPDCVPLTRDWLKLLHQFSSSTGARVAGPIIDPKGAHPHINGDSCLLSSNMEFLKWLTIRASQGKQNAGWDWQLSTEFSSRGWANIPWIISLWNTPTFHESQWAELTAAGIKWVHGVKNFSLLELARRKLL